MLKIAADIRSCCNNHSILHIGYALAMNDRLLNMLSVTEVRSGFDSKNLLTTKIKQYYHDITNDPQDNNWL